MREILFKAKRKDNGEWVEGYLFETQENSYIAYNGQFDDDLFLSPSNIFIRVDKNTICQYTGLIDKNGNKIWEYDIVVHTYTTYKNDASSYPPFRSEDKKKNYVIKWDSTASYCGYRYHNKRNIFPLKKGTIINGDDEVIGNIFDNAELLEGQVQS